MAKQRKQYSTKLQPLVALIAAMAAIPTFAQADDAVHDYGGEKMLPTINVKGDDVLGAENVRAKDATVGVLGNLPLIETPFSVNIITHTLIEKQQAAFIGDVLKNDPSVAVGNVAVPFLLLRGFSVGTGGSLYDGLPGHGGLSDGRAGMQLIDRVEVLKGASAFLYGISSSGSLGGIVNYVPKLPTDAPQRSIGVGYANRSLFSIDTDLSDRFGADGQFGYRVNLGLRDGEQAVSRYKWNQQAASLALDWRARPGLIFNLVFEHLTNHLPELPPFYFFPAGLDVPTAPNTTRSAALTWDDFKTESDNVYARVDWAVTNQWNLTAQALHNKSGRPETKEARFGQIYDSAGDAFLFASKDVSSATTDSVQVLLHGKVDTASVKHRLTFGISGSKENTYGDSVSYPFLFPTNIYHPVDSPEPADVALNSVLNGRVHSRSFLTSDLLEFNEHWSVLLGARRASMKVDNFDPVNGDTSNDTTKTLPTTALLFKPMPGALIYINSSRGLEQGGARDPVTNSGFLPPLLTKQTELGAKLDRGGMSYTGALFNMERPLERLDIGTGLNVQRGQQRHRGIELLANGDMTSALTVVSGLTLLDTRISDTGNPASEGKHAPGVPRVTANIWAEYRLSSWSGMALNSGVFYSGSQYYDDANTQVVPSWTRLDIGASYDTRVTGLPTRILLGVENVTNKRYWASSHGGILTMADPLTLKIGARFDF